MQWWPWALKFIGIGWYVAFTIILGAGLGLWLDRKLGSTPWLAILGILLGSFLAFFGLYQMLVPGLQLKGKGKGKP